MADRLTDAALAKLEARYTEGRVDDYSPREIDVMAQGACALHWDDCEFLGNAVRDARVLVAEVRALRAEVERLRAIAYAAEGYLLSEGGPGDDDARLHLCTLLADLAALAQPEGDHG